MIGQETINAIIGKLLHLFTIILFPSLKRFIWRHSKFVFDCFYHPQEIWGPAFLEARIYNRSIFSVEIENVMIISNKGQLSFQLITPTMRLKPDEFIKCNLSATDIYNKQERKLILGPPPYRFVVTLSTGSRHLVDGELDNTWVQSIYEEAKRMLASQKSIDEIIMRDLKKAEASINQKERESK